ncbi:PREDICTED: uncharacterized protein DDB_G0283697-like [Camelina sativa]|uniref:Uncharacterized protein DDB_G0283697-like n=1 Tax=Camelina sativa TaxID=90675 RepID=A0ABM0W3P1_CAMSA|nr:PREDICTED: uncharacterized protein DDB_G0283697-like [Camelina sativa]XP_010465243.1 PREDICTED: uncharacterized protein DDB_G0283697-like [Camelina sativa]
MKGEEKKKVSEKVKETKPETTMEIEGEDGTKLLLKAGVKSVFGRGAGFKTDDLSVSRRHVSFELKPTAAGTERSESGRVYFEVLGRNPVWLKTGEPGKKIQTFRKSETGEIAAGDRFCVSGHNPIWFTLKKRRNEVMEERALDSESELGVIDISDTDPVKEFGFLVIGKEFDQYPKSRIRDVKQWEWFLEDSTNGNCDDDEGDKKGRKGLSKKRSRKKGNEDDDDDDWSVESDEDKELIVKSKRVLTPAYSTRSKKMMKKDTNASCSSSTQTKQRGRVESEDDDDETLGGFIVSDKEDKLEEEDESNVEEEEEDLDEDEDEELD